jgi:hypothetical protein
MRKPIKPFAVETRRAGRKPVGNPFIEKNVFASPAEDDAPRGAPEWPPVPDDDDSYVAAMRAADALFSRPAPQAEAAGPSERASAPAEPPRRILESLIEDDRITRILAEEDESRPRRGRKPREPGDEAPAAREPRLIEAPAQATAVAADAAPAGSPFIAGYVRGQIYGRYARHSEARPGEQWRKRGLKPNW